MNDFELWWPQTFDKVRYINLNESEAWVLRLSVLAGHGTLNRTDSPVQESTAGVGRYLTITYSEYTLDIDVDRYEIKTRTANPFEGEEYKDLGRRPNVIYEVRKYNRPSNKTMRI